MASQLIKLAGAVYYTGAAVITFRALYASPLTVAGRPATQMEKIACTTMLSAIAPVTFFPLFGSAMTYAALTGKWIVVKNEVK